jgi:hypothetical protein
MKLTAILLSAMTIGTTVAEPCVSKSKTYTVKLNLFAGELGA